MLVELVIEDVIRDIADANDPEVHRIIGVEGHGDPYQKTLRLARRGEIPGHQPWKYEGKIIFFKSELRRHMAARAQVA